MSRRPTTKPTRPGFAPKAADVRLGQDVIYKGAAWSVWAQHPDLGHYWLSRWVDGTNETAAAKLSELAYSHTTHQRAPR